VKQLTCSTVKLLLLVRTATSPLLAGTGADLTTNSISGTSGVGAIGVFVGCEYVNAQGQTIFAQYYPSGTANGGAIKAYVVDDPNVLFQVQANAAMDQSDIGANVYFTTAQTTSTGEHCYW
jgi:hypothetical protein